MSGFTSSVVQPGIYYPLQYPCVERLLVGTNLRRFCADSH